MVRVRLVICSLCSDIFCTILTYTHTEDVCKSGLYLHTLSSQFDFIKDVPPVQHYGRVNENGWEMRALDMGRPDLMMDSSV